MVPSVKTIHSLFCFVFNMHWCFAYMCVCVRVSDLEVTDSCELSCGFWDLNLGPLEEQPVLLTTEPSLQPRQYIL